MVTFTKLATKPALHSVEDMDVVYAAMLNSVPVGWVAKHKGGQWCAWNSYGDFWVGYALSRETATVKMIDAPWTQFVRAK